jgi:hypothetical protein
VYLASVNRNGSWRRLLSEPGENGHIVQLYQDDAFYSEAIAHFTAEGLIRGESIILVATKSHWQLIDRQLRGKGFRPDELFRRGQLTLLDADDTLPKFMSERAPDGAIFKPLARSTIARARADGKFPRVRWWGEMVNVLYVDGNPRGSTQLEEFFDQVAHEENIAIFCSFLMDKFDPRIYEEAFGNVCRTHSHVIPAADEVLHRTTVDRAIEQVVGDIGSSLLESLGSWNTTSRQMPASQELVLWLKQHRPQHFDAVLARARDLEVAGKGQPA